MIVALIVISILCLILLWLMFCGYQWCFGPFHRLHNQKTARLKGNKGTYSLENAGLIKDSPLKGKKLIFLGSSVTYGASSQGVSFPDFIGKRNDCTIVKEAVSGTTLTDDKKNSYISRLKKRKEDSADRFICQLSTNDATKGKELGTISSSYDRNDFDSHTIIGSIETIIAYARKKWNCPIVFFTNPRYKSQKYSSRVSVLKDIADKWNINVIDLWNNEGFNKISEKERQLYRADRIHPTKAGYLLWWTPVFEERLYSIIKE